MTKLKIGDRVKILKSSCDHLPNIKQLIGTEGEIMDTMSNNRSFMVNFYWFAEEELKLIEK